MSKLSSHKGYEWLFRLVALLLLGLIVGYLTGERKFGYRKLSAELCMTSGCISAANVILQSMNRSADPCEDFYSYACGNFKHSKLIPLNRSAWHGGILKSRIQNYFLSVLKSKAKTDKVLLQAQLFYDKCVDYNNKRELISDVFVYEAVKNIGFFPELGINLRKFDIADTFTVLNSMDIIFFIHLRFLRKPLFRFNNTVTPILDFEWISSRATYNRTAYLQHHRTVLAQVMAVFNLTISDVDMPAIEKITHALQEFYRTAKEKLPTNLASKDGLQNFTIGELQKAIPMINITRYFMGQSYSSSSLEISDSTVIPSLVSLEVLESFNRVLEEIDKDVLRHMILDVVGAYAQMEQKYFTVKCYAKLQSAFVAPISGLFGGLFTKPEEKAVVKEMANDLIDATIEILQESDWMDEKTREYAADKARKMGQCIAYPDEWLDPKNAAKDFEFLNITKEDSFVAMGIKLNQFRTHIMYRYAFRPIDRSMLCRTMETSIINALYVPKWNTFEILSGFIQEPLFDYLYPKIYFYATIGTVVGHEIMHGFDSGGRNYDSDGQEADWWSTSSRAEYDKRRDCFIDQYNKMISDGLRENGTNSIKENIADNAGLSVSMRAIKRLIERHRENRMVLPGLHEFTPEQTFFLSFGQLWCSVTSEDDMVFKLVDVHAFNRNRINGPVTNHKEFAEAFQCKPGSNHNPKDEERCVLW